MSGIRIRRISNKEWHLLQHIVKETKTDVWFYLVPLIDKEVVVHDLEEDVLLDLKDALMMLDDAVDLVSLNLTPAQTKAYINLLERMGL